MPDVVSTGNGRQETETRVGNCKIEGPGYIQAVHSKEKKHFGIKIYKMCDEAVYTCAMKAYLGKDSHPATDDMIATQANVKTFDSQG
jgi:hypothetical protein